MQTKYEQALKMNKIFTSIVLLLFVLAGLGNLLGQILPHVLLSEVSKVLLMPLLAIYFFLKKPASIQKEAIWIGLALLFCWGGDILLIFVSQNELFFMLGLLSFLIGHIFYIVVYRQAKEQKHKTAILYYKPHWITPFLIYSLGLYNFLWPHLGSMQIPVLVYTIVLMLMGIFSLNRYDLTPILSFRMVLVGACLFIISDSMIALNRFGFPFDYAGFWIMLTYILAQWCIVRGLLVHFERE
jgi:uncharacterized membrane protein YhhN